MLYALTGFLMISSVALGVSGAVGRITTENSDMWVLFVWLSVVTAMLTIAVAIVAATVLLEKLARSRGYPVNR